MLLPPLIHGILSLETGTLACPTRDASPFAVPLSHRHRITCRQCLQNLTTRSRGHGLPEKHLQGTLRQAALLNNWLYYHTQDSRHSPEGFPDICAVRGERLLFAELKRTGVQPTAAQQAWLEALTQVRTVGTYLWHPEDMEMALAILRY